MFFKNTKITKVFASRATERDEYYSKGKIIVTSTYAQYMSSREHFFSWSKPWDLPPKLFNETAGDETENVGVPPTPVIGGEANDPSMLIFQCPPNTIGFSSLLLYLTRCPNFSCRGVSSIENAPRYETHVTEET
jgi:hypothetical protein